jgi:hypothetical protein
MVHTLCPQRTWFSLATTRSICLLDAVSILEVSKIPMVKGIGGEETPERVLSSPIRGVHVQREPLH